MKGLENWIIFMDVIRVSSIKFITTLYQFINIPQSFILGPGFLLTNICLNKMILHNSRNKTRASVWTR